MSVWNVAILHTSGVRVVLCMTTMKAVLWLLASLALSPALAAGKVCWCHFLVKCTLVCFWDRQCAVVPTLVR